MYEICSSTFFNILHLHVYIYMLVFLKLKEMLVKGGVEKYKAQLLAKFDELLILCCTLLIQLQYNRRWHKLGIYL